MEEKVISKKELAKSCIICVGSTGTGKSTLIKMMTGQEVESNSGAESVTTTSAVYKNKRQDGPRDQLWLDTQGWEDSDIDKQDNQIFRDIFQCLYDEKITYISGIIWTINPNERATDTLQRQARLIHSFGNVDETIWNRVMIVCKKPQEPDLPFQGAKKAILKTLNVNSEDEVLNIDRIPHFGFTIYADPQIQKKLNKYKVRHRAKCPNSNNASFQHPVFEENDIHMLESTEFCNGCNVSEASFEKCESDMCLANRLNLSEDLFVMTDDEIRKEVSTYLGNFNPIQIKYRKQKCRACGVVTDARLMPYKCHTLSRKSHGKIDKRHILMPGKRFHTGKRPPYHISEGIPRFGGTKFTCCGKTERSFWNDKDLKKSGCENVWSCCKKQLGSVGCSSVMQYLCCQSNAKSHKLPAVKCHTPVTEFPFPGWGFNPWNWNIGGFWSVQYEYKCGHSAWTPGCR